MISVDGASDAGILLVVTWSVFGVLHTIAWNYDFPTVAEKTLWLVSSLTLAGSPVIAVFGASPGDTTGDSALASAALLLWGGLISRLLLVSLMLASLRSLPSSAYQTIPWTDYIPHL